jgi:(E)-4-hydroxy-3-methylbut-2-enyl-diphosphate synthase
MIFAHGKPLRKVAQDRLVEELFAEIDKSLARGGVEADARKAAEAADWLERIERENAGELTPERIAAMEAAAAQVEENDPAAQQEPEAVAGRRFNRAQT